MEVALPQPWRHRRQSSKQHAAAHQQAGRAVHQMAAGRPRAELGSQEQGGSAAVAVAAAAWGMGVS